MRERVELFGGAFEAGPLPGAGFRVRAHCRSANASPAVGRGSDPLASLILALLALGLTPPAGAEATSPYDAAIHLSGGSVPARGEPERAACSALRRHRFRRAGLAVAVDSFRVPGKGRSRNVVGELDGPGAAFRSLWAMSTAAPMAQEQTTTPRGRRPGGAGGEPARPESQLRHLARVHRSRGAGFTHAEPPRRQRLVGRVKRQRQTQDLRFAYDNDEVGRGGRFWLRSPAPAPRPGLRKRSSPPPAPAGSPSAGFATREAGTPGPSRVQPRGPRRAVLEGWRGQEPCAASSPAIGPVASRSARSTEPCGSRRS